MTTYSYRPLCKLDTVAFSRDILSSRLCTMVADVYEYIDLFDDEVKCILDIHAPLCTGHRCCSQHNSHQLSDEA